MRLPDTVRPVRMRRVALAARLDDLRTALVTVAAAGTVQLDRPDDAAEAPGPAGALLRRSHTTPAHPTLTAEPPDLTALERDGLSGPPASGLTSTEVPARGTSPGTSARRREDAGARPAKRRAERGNQTPTPVDLVAGEAQLEEYTATATRHGAVAALTGWSPEPELPALTERLAGHGAALVPLPTPRGVDPPTLLRSGGAVRGAFSSLVSTYGTVPYPDVDPTPLAGAAYVLMFGMMFGDAGHGLALVVAAVLLRAGLPRRLHTLRRAWPFVGAAGLAAIVFGALYGEFFGPTGVLPVLWLAPLDEPVRLLVAAVAVGAVLLAAAYAVAVVNRWREGGPRLALYASSGVAGLAVFLGLGALAGGWYLGVGPLTGAGGVVAAAGLVLAALGFHAEAGGGAGGVAQAGVELFDTVIRLGSNLFSFARLAAFGLTHAALGWLVWSGTTALFGGGWLAATAGLVVFVAGNVLAFALEALVAGIQALRLEFYELFSRIFTGAGEPFRPWHLPLEEKT